MMESPVKTSKIWWLWLPAAFMVFQIGLETFLPTAILSRLHTENGPHELLQFLAVFSAFGIALATFLSMDRKRQKWFAAWIGLAMACCFYVAGEEISWGQHFMAWTTPEFWSALNDQHETNLHNTSSWLDQKPRLLLEIGVLCGGILLPLLMKYRPALVPARFAVIYPPRELVLIAALALGVKIIAKTSASFGIILFERVSEVEELYLYYFVLLYLVALKKRAAS